MDYNEADDILRKLNVLEIIEYEIESRGLRKPIRKDNEIIDVYLKFICNEIYRLKKIIEQQEDEISINKFSLNTMRRTDKELANLKRNIERKEEHIEKINKDISQLQNVWNYYNTLPRINEIMN